MVNLVQLYQAHGKFYKFVAGLEGAAVAALVSYSGGLPSSKTAAFAAAGFFGKALWGYLKAYLIANYASSGNSASGNSGN